MAKGKFRGSAGSKSLLTANGGSGGVFKGGEMYSTEFDINETPPSARTLLTKGYIQDEINNFSGATVSTRGRFMTELDKQRCPDERPLYLFIQGHARLNIDLALRKINEIIKTEHRSSLSRPSRFTNAPPPLMSLHSGVPSVEKICIGIDNAPPGFDLRGRIIGAAGANLLYIRGETGATVTLRGRGSQFVEPALGTESPQPLHLHIEHKKLEGLQNAKQLGINLIQTMQSELQAFIQQQPPPVQQQQILEATPIQHIQQAHFQTMNIGALTQSNVVTIQHQDIIQHPQSSVVTLPATILTATVPGTPGTGVTVPPPGLHVPAPILPPNQAQDLQTFVSPPPVGQVQLFGPPPSVSQVQYQIHPGQPLHIQMPPSSHSSPQPVTQMYVMSQPPPQQSHQNPPPGSFIASPSRTAGGAGDAVSYVYAQPNISRSASPASSHPLPETVNVNLQQPPPAPPTSSSSGPSMSVVTQQPPPSLLHLHFPPPNFPPNHPPPPIPQQTYQIQYHHHHHHPQQASCVPQTPTQFVLQEHVVPQQISQNHNGANNIGQQIVHHSQFEAQPPPAQHPLQQVPPPSEQTFLLPTGQSPPHHHHHQHPQHPHHHHQHHRPPGGDSLPPNFDCPMEPVQHAPPQPVPPPQMVPPPNIAHLPNPMNLRTSVPPPQANHQHNHQHHAVQNAPWLYQAPAGGGAGGQTGPMPQVHTQIHYHAQQLHYQNGHVQAQLHYTLQPPPGHQQQQQQQTFELQQKPDSPEQKCQGVKRRFTDVEGPQEAPPYQCGPPQAQRQGNGGEGGERQRRVTHGPMPVGGAILAPHGERNKPLLLLSPPHSGEKHSGECRPGGTGIGNENKSRMPAAPWQPHHGRIPWGRPPPPPPPPPPLPPLSSSSSSTTSSSRMNVEHQIRYPAPPPPTLPTNMPPPQPPRLRHPRGDKISRTRD